MDVSNKCIRFTAGVIHVINILLNILTDVHRALVSMEGWRKSNLEMWLLFRFYSSAGATEKAGKIGSEQIN